ncbi:hypothetical protein C8F01DRAFT_607647 [Mycena amicta]|nr:hypothetical protein C8F01DRAFT_607647 [Mycena amicta]
MSSPRRRTLDTLPPQLPFLVAAHGRHGRVPTPIDVQLADGGKTIRPLPRIPPSPHSAPPIPTHNRQHSSARPLPSLPESGDLTFSFTPATPLPPTTPLVESSSVHLAPPNPTARRGPTRYASLSLKLDLDSDLSGPSSPTLPEPPSPRTAHRLRNSKLRRHLGESVQMVLDSPEAVDVFARLRHTHTEKQPSTPPYMLDTILDLRPESDSSSDDGDSDEDQGQDTFYRHPSPPKQKWVRERGKHRWTEDNFSQILCDLRNL